MEHAASEEKARKTAALEASRKRSSTNTPVVDAPDSKRVKLEHDTAAATSPGFDFSSLPANLVTDLIVANLQAFTENALIGMVHAYRHKKTAPAAATPDIPGLSPTPPPTGPTRSVAESEPVMATPPPAASRAPPSEPRADRDRKPRSATPPIPASGAIKQEEPVDPLKMDIDDEEMEYEPERLNMEVRFALFCRLRHELKYATDVWRRRTCRRG